MKVEDSNNGPVMVVYCDLVNQLRMCRSDLSESVIVEKVQKLASKEEGTLLTHKHLRKCIKLAMLGKLMPWEEKPITN